MYGSGGVEGVVAQETLTFNTLKLQHFKVAQTTTEDPAIASFLLEGLCGLAFPALSVLNYNSKPLPSLLAEQYTELELLDGFSFYLTRDPAAARKSFLTFGGYDLDVVGPDALFYYTPLVGPESFYTVQVRASLLIYGYVSLSLSLSLSHSLSHSHVRSH